MHQFDGFRFRFYIGRFLMGLLLIGRFLWFGIYLQYHNGQILNGQAWPGTPGNIYLNFCSDDKIWLGIWPTPSQTCPPNLNPATADNGQ